MGGGRIGWIVVHFEREPHFQMTLLSGCDQKATPSIGDPRYDDVMHPVYVETADSSVPTPSYSPTLKSLR